jgi:hypothetical protein
MALTMTPLEQAERDAAVERERKMILFRQGKLSFHEAEELSAELCRQGDQLRRAEAEKATREDREKGARLRAGTI